ncbi:MAG: DMT family transporter [Nitriliruptorales bacterium]|nr:DMT family transporter [Nitriliruptorales bacterium]
MIVLVPSLSGADRQLVSRDTVILGVLALVWGITSLGIKFVVSHVSPLWLVAGRVWAGLSVVLLVMWLRGRRLPRSPKTWGHLAVLGTLGTALPWVLVAWAQADLPASLGAVLAAPLPATTLALGAAVGLERVTTRRVVGLAVALVGTLWLVGGGLSEGGPPVAIATLAGTTLLFSFGTVYAKRYLAGMPGVTVAAGQLTVSALFVLPFAVLGGDAPAWGAVPLLAWGAWLALGAIGTGLTYTLYYGLIDRTGAAAAQLAAFLVPPIGAFAGWLALNEELTPSLFAGTAVILLGLMVMRRERGAEPVTSG